MVTFWLLSSYVIGRYQMVSTGYGSQLLSVAFRTGVTLSFSLGAYLAYFWVTAAALGARDSRGFMVPLLLTFAFLSSISQSLLMRVIRANTQQLQKWLFLGVPDTLDMLVMHMAWPRLPVSLTGLTELNHRPDLVLDDYSGVLVSDFNSLPVAQEKQLLRLQQKGVLVLSLVGWCEQVLQRFPPELLTNADLLRGEF